MSNKIYTCFCGIVGMLFIVCMLGAQTSWATQEQLDQARALRLAGQFPEAEALLRAHLEQDPFDVDVVRRLAEILAYQDRFEESEDTIDEALAMDPNNADVRLTYARILSWTQRFRAAEEIIDELLVVDPESVEFLTFKGRLLIYQSKFGSAEEVLQLALAKSPEDMEALLAMGDLMRAKSSEQQALQYYRRADGLYPNDRQIMDRIERPEMSIPQPLELRLAYNRSGISRVPLDDWQDINFSAAYRADLNTRIVVGLQHSDRFGLNDTFLSGEVIQQFNEHLAAGFGAGVTSGPEFLQKWQLLGHASLKLRDGDEILGPTVIGARGELREYANGTVKTFSPNIVQYLADGEIWVSINWINAWDTTNVRTSGILGRLDYQISDRWRVYGGYAKAPESDRGVVTDTDSWFLGTLVNLNKDFFAEFTYGEYDRTGSYLQRSGQVTLGIRY